MPGRSLSAKTTGRSWAPVGDDDRAGPEPPHPLRGRGARAPCRRGGRCAAPARGRSRRRSCRTRWSAAGAARPGTRPARPPRRRPSRGQPSRVLSSSDPPASDCSSTSATRAPARAAVSAAASPVGPGADDEHVDVRGGRRRSARSPRSSASRPWPGRPRATSPSYSSTVVASSIGSGNGSSICTRPPESSAQAAVKPRGRPSLTLVATWCAPLASSAEASVSPGWPVSCSAVEGERRAWCRGRCGRRRRCGSCGHQSRLARRAVDPSKR